MRFTAQGAGLTAYFTSADVLFRFDAGAIRLRLMGAAREPAVEGLRRIPATANFLSGDPDNWRTGVPLYSRVAYRNVYPGIDMAWGSEGRRFKSEFVVAPGADPSMIQLRYEGGTARLGSAGTLIIQAGEASLIESPPEVFQLIDGGRVTVEAAYRITDEGDVTFQLGRYDPANTLVIDPVIGYSTYIGGHSNDSPTAIATDTAGNIYIAGYTDSSDFPTSNPLQNARAGSVDAFVAKFDSSGALVYSTYLGGTGDDRALAIAVDSNRCAYVAGYTTSRNFPVKSGFQIKQNGARNAFVVKLNSAGNALVYGTYLGGTAYESANAIAVDASGTAYIAGDSTSPAFPTTTLQRANRGMQDAFVAHLSASGAQLLYSTLLGGDGDDHASGIAIDSSGAAYVTGYTFSTNFPTASPYQPQIGGGQDAFITKLAAAGNQLVYSTYWGGSAGTVGYPESGNAIAVDSTGQAYVTGVTSSSDFPLVAPMQNLIRGMTDAFAVKLGASGTPLYSTYFGGTGWDSGNAIKVDSKGVAHIAGNTFSSDLPVASAFQATGGGDYDAFLAELSASGDSLVALSYLGGNGSETAAGLVLDATGRVWIVGQTLSTNFPVQSAYQSSNYGNYGGFLTRVALTFPPTVGTVTPGSGNTSSQTFTLTFTDGTGYSDIDNVQFLVNTSTGSANACLVKYVRPGNQIWLAPDSGSGWLGPISPGTSNTLQNTQCTLNATGSGIAGNGTNLTVYLNLSFAQAFAGDKILYASATDAGGLASGWQQKGTWTVPGVTNSAPTVGTVSPASGSGTARAFVFTFTDTNRYSDIENAQLLVGTSTAGASSCWVKYVRATNQIWLAPDSGSGWTGPMTAGAASTLTNSQCTVNGSGSGMSGSVNDLSVILNLSFTNSFTGAKNLYGTATDNGGLTSGWQQRGSWTIPLPTSDPTVGSASPATGTGTAQTFVLTVSDANGYGDIQYAQLLINTSTATANACLLKFVRSGAQIWLAPDSGSGWLGPITAGAAATLNNTQCTVNATGSGLSGGGTDLNVILNVSFATTFAGTKNVYGNATDNGGLTSGWQSKGTWTVPAPTSAPVISSVSPSSGTGTAQTLVLAVSDSNGYGDIATTELLLDTSTAGVNACHVKYTRATNQIWLTPDNGTGWLGPIAPGTAATLSNTQCTINGTGSGISGSGTTLSFIFKLSFGTTFTGTKNVYGTSTDNGGLTSGWQQKGTWTIPSPTSAPTATSVLPAAGSGSTGTLVFTFSDANGYGDLDFTEVLVGNDTTGAVACWVKYTRNTNQLWLAQDGGAGWVGPATPGASTTLANSRCTLNVSKSGSSGSGNDFQSILNITFNSSFSGTKYLYGRATDKGALDSGWQQRGTWTVP